VTARRVVISGDDFGRSSSINQAIILAHRCGVLTSTSLMVTGDAAEEAVELARAHPKLAVGLHLVLAGGAPAADPARIPHLVDSNGRLPRELVRVGLRFYFSSAARRELALEIDAQLALFARTGLTLAHVDGHHHMHMHPAVLPLLVARARRAGAPGLRVVQEDLTTGLRAPVRRLPTILLLWVIYALLAHRARARGLAGLVAADRVYGLLLSGRLSERELRRVLSRVEVDAAEIYLHPDLPGGTIGSADELSALLHPAIPALLRARSLETTTYPGLAA
jgi:chitin disaccharide deacetylase